MTHFVRPAALAEALDPDDWDVFFWTPKRYHSLLRKEFSGVGDLSTIDPDSFLDSLAHGRVAYTAEALHEYVRDDLEIFRAVDPDLVLGDFRLSLNVSAPLAAIPFGSIFNAHWSPQRSQPAIVPELPVTRWLPPALLNPVFAVLKRAFYAWHAKHVNDVRRSFGLSRLPLDIRSMYLAGDLVLYPDIPEFVPLRRVPPHHHYVGICSWSPAAPKPPWWEDVMSGDVTRVLVSLGSSGSLEVVPSLLDALSELPVRVLLATSGRPVPKAGSNVYIADLLPYEEAARRCALVVSHGGTGGLYLALAAGAPMLAIPANVDNHLATAILVEQGAGLCLRVEQASPKRALRALWRILTEPRFKEEAMKWAAIIASHDTRRLFPAVLRQWFAERG